MNGSLIYVLVALAALALLAYLFIRRKPVKKFTPLAGLAFAFIIAGLVFREPRLLGYSLIGVGVLLAIIDIAARSRQ